MKPGEKLRIVLDTNVMLNTFTEIAIQTFCKPLFGQI